jgi:hypothetical protein
MESLLSKLTKPQLLLRCEELHIKKYKSKGKHELIKLIEANTESNNNPDNNNNPKDKNKTPTLTILNEVLKKHDVKQIAKTLNLAAGTINRWIELNNVPKAYEFDLLKLLSVKIDYSKYSSKEKDQLFTPVVTAKHCQDTFYNVIKNYNDTETDYTYIEPSAGDGSFLKVLPPERTIAFDIEPQNNNIISQDYLDWIPTENRKYVVFGNPPFGLRGHMALRFINHSNKFADYVCFILPQLFESDGKGVPRKRVEGFNLIHSEKLQTKFYEPNKNEIEINTIFQIWSKYHKNETYDLDETDNPNLKVYSLSDGGTSSSTRNKEMLLKCDLYLPSTCFGKENMKYYTSFENLPGKKGYGVVFNNNKQEMHEKAIKIIWNEIAFLSTNSAYNLRSSQIYNLFK